MTTTPDDQVLLTAWITHTDEAAFQALVGRYAGLVQGTCRRIAGDGQLADDAAQATFLILWRKAAGLSANVILAGWLHGVARHAALKVVRGEVRRKQREYQAAKESADMSIEPGWTEIAPLLDEALASLGVAEREAVTLRFLAGRTWEETAAILGVARNTAEKRVGRALERLRDLFARRGVTISASALAAILTTAPVEAAGPALGFTQDSQEATRLAGETIRAMTGKGWLPLAWAAGVVLALGAGLAWTLAAAPPPQAEPPPVAVAAVEPPPGLPPPETTRLVVRQGHSSLGSLKIQPSVDGQLIGSCDMFKNELRIWDGQQPDRMLLAADFNASAMAFAPDRKGFAVLSHGSPNAISLWSWPAGRLLRRLNAPGCHQNKATIAYLNGGSHLLANSDGGAAIYDLASGAVTRVNPFSPTETKRLSPTETKRLAEIERDLAKAAAFIEGMRARVMKPTDDMERLLNQWQALESERVHLIGGRSDCQIATVRDGALIIVLRNDSQASRPPSVCDPSTGLWLRTCEDRHPIAASYAHQTHATLTSSIAGNRIAVVRSFHLPNGARTQTFTVWDADTGLELAYLERPDGLYGTPVLLPDDSALVKLDAAIGRWRWASGEVERLPIAMGRGGEMVPLDSQGRRIALIDYSQPGRVLDRETGLLTPWNAGGRTEICDTASLAIGPGGRLVAAAGSDCRIALWDLAEARMRAHTVFGKPSQGGSEWTHLAFASDARSVHLLQGSRTSGSTTAQLGRWALDDSPPETWWSGTVASTAPYSGLAINGHWAAALDGRELRRFDLLAQAELPRIPLPALPTSDKLYRGLSSLSDAGLIQLCAGFFSNHRTALYDLRSGSLVPVAGGGLVATSPDGQWRLATSDTATELQELPTGRVVASLPTARSLSFADDSRGFLLITRMGLGIGTIPTAREPLKMQELPGSWITGSRGWYTSCCDRHLGSSYNVRLLPGGRGILAGHGSGMVLVDVATNTEVAKLRAWLDGSWLIEAPDGTYTGSPGIAARLTLIDAAGQALGADRLRAKDQPEEMRRRLRAYVADPDAADRLPPLPAPQAKPGAGF